MTNERLKTWAIILLLAAVCYLGWQDINRLTFGAGNKATEAHKMAQETIGVKVDEIQSVYERARKQAAGVGARAKAHVDVLSDDAVADELNALLRNSRMEFGNSMCPAGLGDSK